MTRGHRRRFGKLHQTLKDTGFAPTGGVALEYLNYLKGANKLTIRRKTDKSLKPLVNCGVIPFNEPQSATTTTSKPGGFETTWSLQGAAIQAAFSTQISLALLGIENDLSKCQVHSGFYSAILHVTVRDKGAAKVQDIESQITKKKYNAYPTRSGGIPFGRSIGIKLPDGTTSTAATSYEEATREDLLSKVKGQIGGTYLCVGAQITPEEWVDKGVSGKALTGSVPGLIM
jgi:hypothetical protein